MSINKVILLGNLGKEPEVKTFDNGGKIAMFTIATTKKGYTTKNGTTIPDKTEWHNVKVFNGLADVCEKYLHKGSKVYVEGEINYREYTDSTGAKKVVTEILVENLEMCDKPASAGTNVAKQTNPQSKAQDALKSAVNTLQTDFGAEIGDGDDFPF